MNNKFFFTFLIFLLLANVCGAQKKNPNVVLIVVDQLRAQSVGYAGNTDVISPNLDRLAASSVNAKNAVSGMPVCTPFRASLLTGMYPTSNGVFMNDVLLDTTLITMGEVYRSNRYKTAFIGKWHIDGHGRNSYIPPGQRRQGFEYWKALECTHNYNKSLYYAGNSPEKLYWEGYDAIAQSNDACAFITANAKGTAPFLLVVSLGPPHDPYGTAPEKYRALYKESTPEVAANVPDSMRSVIAQNLKLYYSHITAIDDCVGKIWEALKASGIEKNTVLVFTADHGDLMGAHGGRNKQQPYAESLNVPFLLHYPAVFRKSKQSDVLLNSPDIMPTLLALCNLPIPSSVQGRNLSKILQGKQKDNVRATLISCVQPFGQWSRMAGGKEYRGVVTKRYTYVRDLNGPWLLFDNLKDPLQMNNLVNNGANAALQGELEQQLQALLKNNKDAFLPGAAYVKKWGYVLDATETVPYQKINYQGKVINE